MMHNTSAKMMKTRLEIRKKSPLMLELQEKMEPQVPPQPNPLYNSKLLQAHVNALRLEADLFPMRQQVARLMAHPTQ
jgi:hypothetical protein